MSSRMMSGSLMS